MIKPERFNTASNAFVALYDDIMEYGDDSRTGTKRLLNVGFYIDRPGDNWIDVPWRKWSLTYAIREWKWYVSENRSVEELKLFAPIWDKMHSGDNIVNSNYGFQWSRNGQLNHVIELLRKDSGTRRAVITILDSKEHAEHSFDTPCTISIGFIIEHGKLCMNVLMRSNDLWFGFCNDQYCFSELQKTVAKELGIEIGWYYHYASDLHIYEAQQGKLYDAMVQAALAKHSFK